MMPPLEAGSSRLLEKIICEKAPRLCTADRSSGDEASARRVTFHLAWHCASSPARPSGGCAQNISVLPSALHAR